MNRTGRISFTIITLNRKKQLLETIRKVYECQTLPVEVIVIDNNSTDGTEGELKTNFKDVVYKRLDSNLGIGAWNEGFKIASGDFIVIMDDDAYPEFDLRLAIREFEKDPRLGLIAANIVNASTGNSEFSGELLEKGVRDIHYFIGCGAIARKDVLRDAGYYDEKFFLYYNDNDLAARLIKNGFKVRFYREFKFIHKGARVYERTGERFYFEFRNLLWYLIKNFPFFYLARRLFRELRKNFIYALRKGDLRFYFRAICNTVVNLPYLVMARRPFSRKELLFVLGKEG